MGGSGNLGKSLVKKFKEGTTKSHKVFNIDLVENKDATQNYILDP